MKKIDLHMHSTASDGSDTPLALLQKVQSLGLDVFALTDHDTVSGCLELEPLIPKGLTFLPGIEFSCRTEIRRCHILGYNMDLSHPVFQAAIAQGASLRREKLERRLCYLKEQFDILFSDEELEALRTTSSVGKPHLGQLLMQHGYGDDLSTVIRTYLNGCHGGNDRIDAKIAIDAIRTAGGTAVWAHPLGGEGEKRLPPEIFREQLPLLTSLGIQGLECFYSRYSIEEEDFLLSCAEEKQLLVSAGSDYHGKNKTVLLGQLCCEERNISSDFITVLSQ